jgi:type IV secretion system protein VirB10
VSEAGEEPLDSVEGERGIASVNAARSLQSRVSNVLAIALMSTLGVGLLGWYYAHTFTHQGEVKRAAQAHSRAQAAGEMALPSLGKIDPPTPIAAVLSQPPDPSVPQPVLIPPASANPPAVPSGATTTPHEKTPEELILERRLGGPVSAGPQVHDNTPSGGETPKGAAPAEAGESPLAAWLHPSPITAASARVLPAQRLLLPKGAFIDCTLETAIDSTLPGMTTCITATDTFGVDGSTVLMERGSKLVGETRGEAHQGQARIFVLWTEARTPTGVIVPLASPGTDELGRSGLPGEVNRHFFQRFGAAILISVIDGAVQGEIASRSNGAVVVNPSTSQDVMTEVLKDTINIPPTISKAQGDRIQVFVARDLDFRGVYELKARTN